MVKLTKKVELNKLNKEVTIKDLTISNPVVYDFLSDKKDVNAWVEKSIIIGCVGLKQMVLAENVDFVEKEFNNFLQKAKDNFKEQSKEIDKKIDETFSLDKKTSHLSKFTSKLDSTFDMDNSKSPVHQFKELIEEYFDEEDGKIRKMIEEFFDSDDGEVKKMLDSSFDLDDKNSALSKFMEELEDKTDLEKDEIEKLLDPYADDSPAKKLREAFTKKLEEIEEKKLNEIVSRLQSISEKLKIDELLEEEKEKGTSKGFDFQDEVYDELERLGAAYRDKITDVGEKIGKYGKKGDVIIEVDGDTKKVIVVECKDTKYSCKKIKDEIRDSMKNRNAQFGIFLFSKKENMPKEFCPIKITDSYIITCMEKENLHLSYRLARIILSRQNNIVGQVDFEKLSKELSEIEGILKNIDEMQRKVSNITNSANYLNQNLQRFQDEIEARINRMKMVLGTNFDKDASISDENETDFSLVNEQISTNKTVETKKLPRWMDEK